MPWQFWAGFGFGLALFLLGLVIGGIGGWATALGMWWSGKGAGGT